MARTISLDEASVCLAELMDAVTQGSERYVIERDGQPVAAIVAIEDLQRIDAVLTAAPRRAGAMALLGAWGEVSDEEIDAFLRDVYAARVRDTGRALTLES